MSGDAHADLLGPSEVEVERRADGTMIVRSPHPLPAYPVRLTDRLDHWAEVAPERPFLRQRDASGAWQTVTFLGMREIARRIAQGLIDRRLSVERPVAILSGNSLSHAMLGLGCMYAGVPYASVSPAYSTIATDFGRLEAILGLLTPGLVFAERGAVFGKAIAAVVPEDVEVLVGDGVAPGRAARALGALWDKPDTPAVDEALARVGPDTIAKFLFTSGSTGVPKGVVNTQRMLCSNQAMLTASFPSMARTLPVLVDWLPWSHTFGANFIVGAVLTHGGTLYIDEGRPLPGAIETTVRNLREVSPTFYCNVPKGYEMLLPFLEREPELRANFFKQLDFLFYAGAALPQHVARRLEELAQATVGRPVPMVTSIGSTETAPSAVSVSPRALGPGVVGIPNLGVDVKLVPNAGKLEVRVRGPNVTPGYWRQPEITAAAFDEEGFYRIGDAFRFADPNDATRGFVFDGRIAEDFKLVTGTWVSVGALRGRLIDALAPLARDAVIAGHDRGFAAALIVPDVDACRALTSTTSASAAEVLADPAVRRSVARRLAALNAVAGGSSGRIERILMLEVAPSIDTGEMTDKGSLNQRRVLEVRAAEVAELYADPPSPRVVTSGVG
jgi:feruloyl-CoA synthase